MENEKVICKPAIGYLHRPDRGVNGDKKGAKEMNKLYAIRDKKTGMFWEFDESIDNWVLSNTWATVLQTKEDLFEPEYLVTWAKENANFYKVEPDLEYVTFREEPPEPCEHCYDTLGILKFAHNSPDINNVAGLIYPIEQNFCTVCGRRLEDA